MNKQIPWTRFYDMNSGGSPKEPFLKIYIQAPEDEAKLLFTKRFGHHPDRITCDCCGPDYAIDESIDLAQATEYDRNCIYNRHGKTIEEYCLNSDILIIYTVTPDSDQRTQTLDRQLDIDL